MHSSQPALLALLLATAYKAGKATYRGYPIMCYVIGRYMGKRDPRARLTVATLIRKAEVATPPLQVTPYAVD